MKKSVVFSAFLFLAASFMSAVWAVENVVVDPNAASQFAMLPAGVSHPEGITADPDGNIYVSTFFSSSPDEILKFNSSGTLMGRLEIGEPLLGLAYNPADQMIYICNAGALAGLGPSRIQRVNTDLTGLETVAVMPRVGAPRPKRVVGNPDGSVDHVKFGDKASAPNALAFNTAGDLFVSDSFQGAVFRINAANTCSTAGPPCTVDVVAHDLLLPTAGFPPFGANGLALNSTETTLYVANTGDDRILALDLASGTVSVFTESINGADGMAFDAADNLVVAANQGDNVLILEGNTGRILAKFGDFLGFNSDGTVNGLLFPASVVIVGSNIFVTNLALPLRGTPDEPETSSALTTFTVSEISIPPGL